MASADVGEGVIAVSVSAGGGSTVFVKDGVTGLAVRVSVGVSGVEVSDAVRVKEAVLVRVGEGVMVAVGIATTIST